MDGPVLRGTLKVYYINCKQEPDSHCGKDKGRAFNYWIVALGGGYSKPSRVALVLILSGVRGTDLWQGSVSGSSGEGQ